MFYDGVAQQFYYFATEVVFLYSDFFSMLVTLLLLYHDSIM